jgi:transposase InsO family protein
MSDVMYGPKIRDAGRSRQTYHIALIDDATRVVPYTAFAFSEGTVAYLAVLEQAVRRRGLPKRLYVDNGAAFRSKQLAIVCAKLGIALIHAKPYSPQGKGGRGCGLNWRRFHAARLRTACAAFTRPQILRRSRFLMPRSGWSGGTTVSATSGKTR